MTESELDAVGRGPERRRRDFREHFLWLARGDVEVASAMEAYAFESANIEQQDLRFRLLGLAEGISKIGPCFTVDDARKYEAFVTAAAEQKPEAS